PGEGTVRLHASAVVHEENAGRLRLLVLSALALQAHEAHATAEELAKRIGGEPDFSSHPRSGTREDPDEVFGVIARAYASAGRQRSPFRGDDCVALLNMQPQPWLTATGDEEGITAEFPFHHAVPVASAALRRAEADPPGGTARLQVM